jgi:2-polyprenyl-3-methyl-5-hydroxy-6-metoxy-1,4-benzoquinol methylase
MTSLLKERYELELAPVTIGGKRLEIYRIANLDPILRKVNEAHGGDIGAFPFWVKVWEAAFILTGHLLRMELDPQTQVLEIGAGMGITGLFLGAAGFPVTISDSDEEALELLEMNAQHNGIGQVRITKLDWADPDLAETFDVICGSELIYNEAAIDPVLHLLKTYLRPQGVVLMAHDIQRRRLSQFMDEAQEAFEVGHVVNTIRSDTDTHRILVSRLRPK